MTACTNHGGKARRVVTAALVGVLSVGTVPMVALATGTTDGIETQAANWTVGAKVTRATDGKGGQISGDLSELSFTKSSGKFLVPTEVTGTFETTDVTEDMLMYRRKNDTHWYTFEQMYGWANGNGLEEDTYTVRVTGTDGKHADFAFKVTGESKAEGVQVKGTLVYNGKPQVVKFVDGEGEDFDTSTATITYTDTLGNNGSSTAPTNAGSYVAKIVMADGVTTYNVPFTVQKLNLSEASLFVEDTTTAIMDRNDLWANLEINSNPATDVSSELVPTAVSGPNGEPNLGTEKGAWTVSIAASDTSKNVTGSGTVTFTLLDDDVADGVKYGRTPYANNGIVNIWLEDGEAFDASKISVVETDNGMYNGKVENTYSGDQLEITYFDKDNNKVVDASALSAKGSYELTIRVKPELGFTSGQWTGGTITLNVEVNPTKVDQDKTLAFYFDGKISGDSAVAYYDGTDQLERLTVAVKDAEGNDYVEGTDYTVEVTNASKKVVDSAVDSDTYYVTVKPVTFEFDGTGSDTFTLTVNKAKIGAPFTVSGTEVLPGLKDMISKYEAPAYTGSAVEIPAVQSTALDADGNVVLGEDGRPVYSVVDASLYNVVNIKKGTKVVSEAKDKNATYTVKIALTDEAAKNYELVDGDFQFKILEYGHFADVASDKWYAVAVDQAWYWQYINGVGGTELFAPEAEITRADVACILFNMAGGTRYFDDFEFNEISGYVTGFDDVDGHAYYAQAIAWAKAFGVVNGHNGQFRPDDKVTREEFATMLANYAKSKGESIATDGSALAALPDASGVSSWAQESVAWAVENEVMGNGGFVAPQDDIARAEVAAMAVNYQPENLEGLNRDNPTK